MSEFNIEDLDALIARSRESSLVQMLALQLKGQIRKSDQMAADNEKAMDSLRQADAAVKLAHEKYSTIAAENVGLKGTISGVQEVYYKSDGVVGYHLNGDIAKWEDVMPDLWAETPATDSIVAGIKADGVEEFIGRLQQYVDDGDFVGDEVAVIVGAIYCGKEFCKQMREGAK